MSSVTTFLRAQTMRRRGGPPEFTALKSCWRRWVEIVELFARRKPARRRVDPETYAALHKELIERCQARRAAANDVEAVFYRYLEDLARPWLTPLVLARADREILLDLLARCRQVEEQLGIRFWRRSIRSWVVPVGLAALAVFVVLLGLGIIDSFGYRVLDRVRGWSDDLWFAVKRSS